MNAINASIIKNPIIIPPINAKRGQKSETNVEIYPVVVAISLAEIVNKFSIKKPLNSKGSF